MEKFQKEPKKKEHFSENHSINRENTISNHHYFFPQTIKEAVGILTEYGGDVKILAGGTDLLVEYYDRLYEINYWMDLRNVQGLKNIEITDNCMVIGAMATHTQLEKLEKIRRYFPILSRSALDIGSPQIRNRGTIGGNIVNASPAGDLLPSLMAYKAQFKLVSNKEEIIVPAEAFFIGPKKTILKADQLLYQIIIPLPEKHTYGSWIKIGKRKALIIATITLALVVKMDENDEIVNDVSVCLGSVAPTPVEVKEIKIKMIGKKFTQLDFNQLGQLVEDKISPIDDIRGTKEYRKDVAKVIMVKALKEVELASRRV